MNIEFTPINPEEWKGRRTRVKGLREVALGVREVLLEPDDGDRFPSWSPGSHVDIDAGGVSRLYSLVASPDDERELRLAVGLAKPSRGGSRWVHEGLAVGDVVVVKDVRNNFIFRDAPGYVFVAGGIGITPLVSMARAAEQKGRSWQLFYGGRTRSSLAYARELEGWRKAHVTTVPQDTHGTLDLASIVAQAPADHLIYACGPPAMLVDLRQACADAGIADRLHLESFSPRAEATSVEENTAFEVVLARVGRGIPVGPDQTILEALEAAGLWPEYGCREGTCGTCEVAVLAGVPDHRDSLLTHAERAANDCVMICTSRSLTPQLVIDL